MGPRTPPRLILHRTSSGVKPSPDRFGEAYSDGSAAKANPLAPVSVPSWRRSAGGWRDADGARGRRRHRSSRSSEGPYAGQFDTLIAAVPAADPAVLDTPSGNGRFTVFAPTDDAFAALGLDGDNIGDLDKDVLTDIFALPCLPGTPNREERAAREADPDGVRRVPVIRRAEC